jgi:hypothetical protein
MKNATAISHGTSRLLEGDRDVRGEDASTGPGGLAFVGFGCIGLRDNKPIIADRAATSIGLLAQPMKSKLENVAKIIGSYALNYENNRRQAARCSRRNAELGVRQS